MRSLSPADLDALLHGPDFLAWWSEHRAAADAAEAAAGRLRVIEAELSLGAARAELAEGCAIEALRGAGALSDAAARLAAGAEELENGSLDVVAAFEQQREHVSTLWLRLGGAEGRTDARRQRVAAARARGAAEPGADRAAAVDLADDEALLVAAGKRELGLDAEYRRAAARKAELWGEVEGLWARSLELALLASERKEAARQRRAEAERLFAEAEVVRERLRALEAERDRVRAAAERATGARDALLQAARERFGCAAGERYLFFARAGEGRRALAVGLAPAGAPAAGPLVREVERTRGVEEPLAARAEPRP